MLSSVCVSVSVCVSFPFFPGSFLFVSFSRDSLNYGKISFNSSDVVLLNFSHNKFHGTLPTYAFVSIAIPSFVDANTIPSTLVSPFNYSLWIWSKSAVSCLNFKFNNFDCPLPGYCSASCSGKATNVCDNKPGEACGILPCGMNSSTSTLSRSLSERARVCTCVCVCRRWAGARCFFFSFLLSSLSRTHWLCLVSAAWINLVSLLVRVSNRVFPSRNRGRMIQVCTWRERKSSLGICVEGAFHFTMMWLLKFESLPKKLQTVIVINLHTLANPIVGLIYLYSQCKIKICIIIYMIPTPLSLSLHFTRFLSVCVCVCVCVCVFDIHLVSSGSNGLVFHLSVLQCKYCNFSFCSCSAFYSWTFCRRRRNSTAAGVCRILLESLLLTSLAKLTFLVVLWRMRKKRKKFKFARLPEFDSGKPQLSIYGIHLLSVSLWLCALMTFMKTGPVSTLSLTFLDILNDPHVKQISSGCLVMQSRIGVGAAGEVWKATYLG